MIKAISLISSNYAFGKGHDRMIQFFLTREIATCLLTRKCLTLPQSSECKNKLNTSFHPNFAGKGDKQFEKKISILNKVNCLIQNKM